ncbi:hypothetical protein [Indiicoccus explosivorum]|uniref:hypothetical protein n=1 Tax=Indiicoccus explosivorum TaxID=1917864 RepID=UPI000B44B410|nr:hypothetical protein [Indiicoccus explosivorum]
MGKKLRALQVLAVLAAVFAAPIATAAEPEISLQAETGFGNKVKYGTGAPLEFTLTNTGSAFMGDLVVEFSDNHNLGGGRAVPVSLDAGEMETIRFSVPGLSENYSGIAQAQSIFLYEGGWEEGEIQPFSGPDTLTPMFFDPAAMFIGTLTSNPDRLLELKDAAASAAGEVQVFHFGQEGGPLLPADVTGLESLDFLVIDEFALTGLGEDVQQAVFQWVTEGGTLVTGTGPDTARELGMLGGYLPLLPAGPATLKGGGFEGEVPGYSSALQEDAAVIAGTPEQPLAAKRQLGAGEVVQAAFSLGDGTVTGNAGYSEFIRNILVSSSPAYAGPGMYDMQNALVYEVASVNELFGNFAVSLPLSAGAIFLYILLTVPVLYFLLKRRDRREYAWIAIPVMAVAASILLFAAGAKDRIGEPQIQQTGFFEADADGGLDGHFVNSLLSSAGGNYRFEAPPGTELANYLSGPFMESSLHEAAILEQGPGGTALTVRDMRYWSVASVIGHTYIEEAGTFKTDLLVADGRLTGTIRNEYPFAVEGAAVWTGTRFIEIGSLDPGEEIDVDTAVPSSVLAPAALVNQYGGHQPVMSEADLIPARKQSVLSSVYNQLAADGETSVYLIAYARDAIAPAELAGQQADISAVNLLVQPISPEVSLEGEITLEPSYFNLTVTAGDSTGFFDKISETPPVYYMEDGTYFVEYSLADPELVSGIDWTGLTLGNAGRSLDAGILNQETGDYDTADPETVGENIDAYVSPEGKVRLQLEIRTSGMNPEITLPGLTLKGVARE